MRRRAVDRHRGGQLTQPAAVLTVAAERLTHLDEPRRRLRERQIALGLARELQRLEIQIAPLFRVRRRERRVLTGDRQAQVTEHPRRFVIAEQDVDLTAGGRRLALETPDEIQRSPGIAAAIDEVAELDEMRGAAAPMTTAVDDTGGLQNLQQSIVGAVHIANGDDTFDVVPLARLAARRRSSAGDDRDGENSRDANRPARVH